MIKYSVIVPVYNEEKSVSTLCAEIKKTMDEIAFGDYEVIFVDDGSTDNSLCNLKKTAEKIKELMVLSLNRNYGQSLSLQAGLDISSGKIIITLDGDLQNNPKDIPKLLNKMREGYDVVCGWAKNKHLKWAKARASYAANYFRRLIFQEKIHDVGCMFRVYTRNSLESISLAGCNHRFLTAILAKKGFKISEVEIEPFPRLFGVSKYGIIDRALGSIPQIFRILLAGNKSVRTKKKHKIEKYKPDYQIKEIIKNNRII